MPSTDPSGLEKEMRERIENEIRSKRQKDAEAEPAPEAPADTAEARRLRMEEEIRQKLEQEITTRRSRPGETSTQTPAAGAAEAADTTEAPAADTAATEPAGKSGDAQKFTPPVTDSPATKDKAKAKGKTKPGTAPKGKAKTKAGGKTGTKLGAKAGGKTGAKTKLGAKTDTRSERAIENDRFIAAEKAKIDKKLKQKQLMLYAAITGTTLVLAAIFLVGYQKRRAQSRAQQNAGNFENTAQDDFQPDPNAPPTRYDGNPTAPQRAPEPPAIDTITSDAIASAKAGAPQEAVATLKARAAASSEDAAACYAAIATICEEYEKSGQASLAWMNLRDSATAAIDGDDIEAIQKAMASLLAFQQGNRREAFLAEIPLMNAARVAYDTGGGIPSSGANNAAPATSDSPWLADSGADEGAASVPTPKKKTEPPRSNDGDYFEFNF